MPDIKRPPKRITDRGFVYTSSANTNIRATFERIRAEQERAKKVVAIDTRRAKK